MTETNRNAAKEMDVRLFAGERLLVMVGLLGFALAAIIALYIGFNGAAVLPEGNLESAFSFDAAIGLFILSIAAIMPLSGFSSRKRAIIRWVFIHRHSLLVRGGDDPAFPRHQSAVLANRYDRRLHIRLFIRSGIARDYRLHRAACGPFFPQRPA